MIMIIARLAFFLCFSLLLNLLVSLPFSGRPSSKLSHASSECFEGFRQVKYDLDIWCAASNRAPCHYSLHCDQCCRCFLRGRRSAARNKLQDVPNLPESAIET